MNAQLQPVSPTQNAPVAQPTAAESAWALQQREALAWCTSTLVPTIYRGKENIGNVLIAMEMAKRIGAGTMQIMQNLHVIQGKPSLSSSFLIATVNACGRFEPLRFEIEGADPARDDYRVRAFATDKKSGALCNGPWITYAMVKGEGWLSKNGSKWKTMPELMFMYRAAAFWARLYAPEVSLGIQTVEEVNDVWGVVRDHGPAAPTAHDNLRTLEHKIKGEPLPDAEPAADAPPTGEITAEWIRHGIENAQDVDALNEKADLIRYLADEGERLALNAFYDARFAELTES